MRLNKITNTPLIFLLLLCIGCTNRNKIDEIASLTSVPENGMDIIYLLDQHFQNLKNMDPDDSNFEDLTTSINNDIKNTIKKINTPSIIEEIERHYYLKGHDYILALSENKNVGVLSWNTRKGHLKEHIKNLVFHVKNGKVVYTYLKEDSVLYNQVYHLKNEKNKNIYIFHGWGKLSNEKYFYRVDAFSSEGDNFQKEYIFPGNKSSIKSYYKLENLDFESQMDFSIEKDGSLILQPEIWGEKVVYHPLEFDGVMYKYKAVTNNIGDSFDIQSFERSNTFGFINGSELPLTEDIINGIKTFLFKNQFKVTLEQFVDNDYTDISVSLYEADTVRIILDNPTISLIGKKSSFLFFKGSGLTDSWPLYIYDLDNKTMLTKNIAATKIKENELVYTELLKNKPQNSYQNKNCKGHHISGSKHYKIYAFNYVDPNPIIQFKGLSLRCSKENHNRPQI
ncbi:hypothetical protein HME9304_03275 [Flagellimonas maritima]|uniref:Uncharacterized protein n=1 Tax=Flagellimonas maritima TaxID=1383885 RepID=A0A2Z4LX02_9FLAO|nr:hypothetical protein [Allomuricauda aurantiaca]AWX46243.1 hypothetical protein HME9304_03275 [Allomuricauda aurantiaca]